MKIYIFTLLAILAFSFTAFGQDIEATTKDGKKVILKADKTWEFINEPLPKKEDKKSGNVSPLIFDDIDSFRKFTQTIKDKLQKSEFETQREFIARIKKLANETQFNNKPLSETRILVPDPELTYNAENQEFTGLLALNVSLMREKIMVVGLTNDTFRISTTFIHLKMTPEKAKEIKPNLKLIVVGYPVNVSYSDIKFFPTKYIFFNQSTNEIYEEINETQ